MADSWSDDPFVRDWIERTKKRAQKEINKGLIIAGIPQGADLTWTAFEESVYALCDHAAASPPQDAPRRAISDDEIIHLIDWIRQHRATLSVAEGSYAPEFIAQTRKEVLALCATPAAPVDLSAVEAAIERYADARWAFRSSKSPRVDKEIAEVAESRAALLSLYRTALSSVPAKEAGETERLYCELLYEVQNIIPTETRHETARRIIRQHEAPQNNPPQSATPSPEDR